jgi:hypothetical protein
MAIYRFAWFRTVPIENGAGLTTNGTVEEQRDALQNVRTGGFIRYLWGKVELKVYRCRATITVRGWLVTYIKEAIHSFVTKHRRRSFK